VRASSEMIGILLMTNGAGLRHDDATPNDQTGGNKDNRE